MTTSTKLIAGDTLSFPVRAPTDVSGNEYAASDGWALTYKLIPRATGGSVITLSAAPDGLDFLVQETAANTAAYTPGPYTVAAYVSKGSERYTVEPAFAFVEILQDPSTATGGFDGRSPARKALDDALAARAAYAAGGNSAVAEYSIGDRRMKFKTPAELEQLIGQLKIEVARESRAQALAQGLPDPRKVFVRAGRA